MLLLRSMASLRSMLFIVFTSTVAPRVAGVLSKSEVKWVGVTSPYADAKVPNIQDSTPKTASIQHDPSEHEAWCIMRDTKFQPLDMFGQTQTKEASALLCQTRCASVTGCAHYSWWNDGACHLQDSAASAVHMSGVTTGRPHCAYQALIQNGMDDVLTAKLQGKPDFTAPVHMRPDQFLIVSSPTRKKVVWSNIQNFQSAMARPFPLIDDGLVEPRGLALDRKSLSLYVADTGAQKIYRYALLIVATDQGSSLTTTGERTTILKGHPVESLTFDGDGNLFYTARDTNNINKLSAAAIRSVINGVLKPGNWQIISERTLEFKSMLAPQRAQFLGKTYSNLTIDADRATATIQSLYEAPTNPHVSSPTSPVVDGEDLFWINQVDGAVKGTVVKGGVNPKSNHSNLGATQFRAVALTKSGDGAFGLTSSEKALFFTRNIIGADGPPGSGAVSGLIKGTSTAVNLVTGLKAPRGLAWDGDRTVYVADEGLGHVWAFAANRLMENVPITKALNMDGAYGIVHFGADEPAFAQHRVNPSGVSGVAPQMSLDEAEEVFLMQTERSFSDYTEPSNSFHNFFSWITG